MFENLLDLVKQNAGDAIINNPAIPNEHNDAAIQTAAGGIMDHLKGMVASGGTESISGLLSGGDLSNNPEVAKISGSVAGSLASKFGISSEQATGVAASLIPMVMGSLVKKTNDPNDKSFDMGSIISAVAGGNTGGIGGLLNTAKSIFGK